MRWLWVALLMIVPIVGRADDRIEHRWRDNDWQTELLRSDSGNYKCRLSKGGRDSQNVAFGGGLMYGIDQQGHYSPVVLLLGDDNKDRLPHPGDVLRLVVDDKDLGAIVVNEPRPNGIGAVLSADKSAALLDALSNDAKRFLVITPKGTRYNFISDGFAMAVNRFLRDCSRLAAQSG